MATVNIRRDVKDSFYRYKMPKLLSKIEGKGNGIKTVIPNMSDIAKSLHRPPTYPTKYFGTELGAQVKFEEDKDRYIVNGAHDAPKLQALLDGFIQKFVLCGSCSNPETDLVFAKDGTILRDCKG
jgi:translation initiation factor 5